MALIGRYNSLQVVKHTNFGLYLDGGADGDAGQVWLFAALYLVICYL